MARMRGRVGKTWGEKEVHRILSTFEDDVIVYTELPFTSGDLQKKPDFIIIHPEWGVTVLEVKDWYQIEEATRYEAKVRPRTGKPREERNPVLQAREAAELIASELEQDEELRNFAGKRNFTYAYACVLTHIRPDQIKKLERVWGESLIGGSDCLQKESLRAFLANVSRPKRARMTAAQIQAACAVIDPIIKLTWEDGTLKGVLDPAQADFVHEAVPSEYDDNAEGSAGHEPAQSSLLEPDDEKREGSLQGRLPDDAKKLPSEANIRLVRGFAGTGKTDVLILRARHVCRKNPDARCLVTTYNRPLTDKKLQPELKSLESRVSVRTLDKLVMSVYKQRTGRPYDPQSTEGILARLRKHGMPEIEEYGIDFLSEEINWMKEAGRTTRDSYVSQARTGRSASSGRRLGKQLKNEVFEIFCAYQAELGAIGADDWPDFRQRVLSFLDDGLKPEETFTHLFIDEAQHFAPSWIQIAKHFLEPGGDIFICDDPSQSVYKFFSWKLKGIEVRGRTKWLRIPYRTTREIFTAAHSIIANSEISKDLLNEFKDIPQPDLSSDFLRSGPKPEIHKFNRLDHEIEWVKRKVVTLVDEGFLPTEIAILHSQKHCRDKYACHLNHGITIDETKRQTGMEYEVVIVPSMNEFFTEAPNVPYPEREGRHRAEAYMTMTRARERLYVLHRQDLPRELHDMLPHINKFHHGGDEFESGKGSG